VDASIICKILVGMQYFIELEGVGHHSGTFKFGVKDLIIENSANCLGFSRPASAEAGSSQPKHDDQR
jgi:hypothetical protein